MELINMLAFLGIAVSAAFGTWGIYLTIKHRYLVQLTFLKDQSIALFDSIVKNLPELEVLYKQTPVTPNLVLLRGALVNTGKKDIAPTMVESPITAVLPDGFKWLTAKVVSASDNVQADIQVKSDTAFVIRTGLVRCQEHIMIQALAEIPTEFADSGDGIDKELARSLRFQHRIEDAGKIYSVELQEEEAAKKRLKMVIIIPIVTILIVCISLGILWFRGVPITLAYTLSTAEGQEVLVSIESIKEGFIEVKGVEKDYEATFPFNEFFDHCLGRPTTIKDFGRNKFALYLLLIGYVFLPLLFLAFRYNRYRKNRSFRIMLSGEKSDADIHKT